MNSLLALASGLAGSDRDLEVAGPAQTSFDSRPIGLAVPANRPAASDRPVPDSPLPTGRRMQYGRADAEVSVFATASNRYANRHHRGSRVSLDFVPIRTHQPLPMNFAPSVLIETRSRARNGTTS